MAYAVLMVFAWGMEVSTTMSMRGKGGECGGFLTLLYLICITNGTTREVGAVQLAVSINKIERDRDENENRR